MACPAVKTIQRLKENTMFPSLQVLNLLYYPRTRWICPYAVLLCHNFFFRQFLYYNFQQAKATFRSLYHQSSLLLIFIIVIFIFTSFTPFYHHRNILHHKTRPNDIFIDIFYQRFRFAYIFHFRHFCDL